MKHRTKRGGSRVKNKFLNRSMRAKKWRILRYGHRYAAFWNNFKVLFH